MPSHDHEDVEQKAHGIRTSFEGTQGGVRESNELTLMTPILGMGFI